MTGTGGRAGGAGSLGGATGGAVASGGDAGACGSRAASGLALRATVPSGSISISSSAIASPTGRMFWMTRSITKRTSRVRAPFASQSEAVTRTTPALSSPRPASTSPSRAAVPRQGAVGLSPQVSGSRIGERGTRAPRRAAVTSPASRTACRSERCAAVRPGTRNG